MRPGAWWAAAGLGLGLLVALVLRPGVASAEWETLTHKDGLLIERRAKEGSAFYEIRATTRSPLSPNAIFETLWKQREHQEFVPHLKRLELLSETSDERLVYEQLAVPLARDRDYTVHLQKRVDLEAGSYAILFATANEAGPPPDASHVRVKYIRGRWLIEPGREGQDARVTYEVLSDPGGALPAWLVNRTQGEAVAKLVRAMLQRAQEKNHPKTSEPVRAPPATGDGQGR
jgi:ribosome-associated toxin RatA of RatAB toxin-antitoxin module